LDRDSALDFAVAAAQVSPELVPGCGQPCDLNLPAGPLNPPRTLLGLANPSQPYYPLFNPRVFKCACS
jgi:hypothetical protein